ncbi:MAG: hypothetical protein LBN25_04245 [Christensenellaceae bacterium]|nr:hypothetical protein [Christensenellaceae bacterium]
MAIPGAHNAGSYTLSPVARCQDGDMREQFNNGVRFFCVRLDTDKKGTIRLAHGPKLGDTLEKGLRDLRAASDAAPNEFYILDLRHYYRLKILFLEFVPKADPKAVDKLISDILEPEKYALSPDLDIKTVTMGDIRKSGKRFLLVNEFEDYDYSTNGYTLRPWTKKVHGMFPKNFVKEAPKFFDYNRSRGLYWAEMQLTANFGTEIGLMNPAKQEKLLKPLVEEYLNNVKSVPERLSKVNIIGCDFLAKDSYKCEKIIALNADKGLFN